MKIWDCKIGEFDESKLPMGADAPLRQAVQEAYRKLTGEDPQFTFSGWGGELTDSERAALKPIQARRGAGRKGGRE